MIRVCLVDDHDVLRQALRSLLETEPDLAVCGEAGAALEAVDPAAAASSP